MTKKIFWLDGWEGKAKGGIFYRAFELNKFIKLCEKKEGKIVGIKFDDESNNMELIYEEQIK